MDGPMEKKENSLKGKKMFNAISTGGRQEAYETGGFNRFTIAQFLAPFDQTARLCNIEYYPPFVIHGTHMATRADIEKAAENYKQTSRRSGGRSDFRILKSESMTYLNELIHLKNGS